MASGLDKLMAPGRHTRRPGRTGVRRVCLAALIMLVAQYGLGIFLNLYVAVPASDAHAGIFGEIATAPLALTVHALLGLALIAAAILLVVRAVSVGDRLLAVLAAAGLTAIGGAFAAGEIFVHNGQSSASLAMAILTGVALLCYVGTLALATTARRQATGQASTRQASTRQASTRQASTRQVTRPRPVPAQASWPIAPPARAPASWFARE
jgi:hypothetical protein